MRSRLGRALLVASALTMAVAPWVADWNRRHTFGPGYGPHARWHGTAEVVSSTGDAVLMLWLLTRGAPRDRALRTAVAALLPVLRYGAFNLTLAVPGTSAFEEGGRPVRVLGLPAALVGQDGIMVLAVAGWWFERRARRG
jgi:hypothetical protein